MRIRPRCFVVMPYGRKPVGRSDEKGNSIEVDFDAVYEKLLVPALRRAGCTWFRSSEENTSADIRTGMFYELATSDFVLSDISILNANVFYELGVRHGLSGRGSILVHGGWSVHPFDIAVDKSFRYDGGLFASAELDEAKIDAEAGRLATRILEAVRTDPRHVSSPVYKELRGLAPPDTTQIEIASVEFANKWYREWREKVGTAQREGATCDILTLAGDAASSLQAAQVFYTAAWALIGLQRFEFAEELLRAAVQADPTHVEAACQLGLVLNRLGRAYEATEYLNRVRRSAGASLHWLGALGRVHKDLWRDSWKKRSKTRMRQEACLKNQARAYEALDLYNERLAKDQNSHYAAINVCAIVTWLKHAAKETEAELTRDDLDELLQQSKAAVRRAEEEARNDRGDKGYWACTSVAELALCEGRVDEARRHYERAAHWPGRGKFDIQSMLSHLVVYEQLGLQVEATRELIRTLKAVSRDMFTSESFAKVALCVGQMTDDLRNPGDLRNDTLAPLAQAIKEKLDKWKFGKDDLAVCRGVRGAEIIFAELCVELEMTVRLLIPLPEGEFMETCVHAPETDWQSRYARLVANSNVSVRFQEFELGAAPPTSSPIRRGLLWCVNTARVAAENARALHLLIVRPETPAESPTGFRATLDEMISLPAIREDIDPGKLPRKPLFAKEELAPLATDLSRPVVRKGSAIRRRLNG